MHISKGPSVACEGTSDGAPPGLVAPAVGRVWHNINTVPGGI